MKLLVALLGKMDYKEALSIQEHLLKLRQQDLIEDTLLLLEHPPVLTMGVRGSRSNIIIPEEVLKAQGVNIYQVNRGGDVTYHGPGQIVGYPILDLNKHGRDIPDFFRKIEETFIQLLKEEYGITAGRNSKYPGVWVGEEKITAIGCAVKRWVTMHGFAFNVNTQLEHFRWINPCGITDRGVTSLQKILGYPEELQKVNEQVVRYFCKIFNVQPEIIDKQKLYQITGRE
ncbi:MAG: lipoyl(octanoyl) transferase LipB [Bacillota bacterium]|uniref:Octanoyltransferase n=1 Tax=Thermanaerosceptrum fracticalcis TaxID=1712410 RepID=A0A7G6E396_THEFR|nr:lipoyl(octanoyl) transferase LipB [Thermanaerosceptrum fracticalcis]QNB46550.1 lipoyl(octanoyl) transferase LipB [Thermanaerosceptrum fracticalcis]